MRRFGLIGRPLGHSLSQRYFEKKFAAEGIGDACYNLYELPDITALENLISAVDGLCGLNVTIPYKQSVIPYLDSTDDEAAAVGAVNCIRISNGHLRGYNTDIEGIRSTLTTLLAQRSIDRALVLGSGGAAHAVRYVLSESRIPCLMVSRDRARGDIAYEYIDADILAAHQLVVNATPAGMWPHIDRCPPLPYDMISPRHAFFDLVYNPEPTQAMTRFATSGAAVAGGMEMFARQAEASWRIWSSAD